MNTHMLKKALKSYWLESTLEHQRNLLVLLTETITKLIEKTPIAQETEKYEDEPFITLMEFYDQTHFCHPGSIAKLIRADDKFPTHCTIRKGKKYYVRPNATLKYLSTCFSPKIRERAKTFLENQRRIETRNI